MKLDSASKQTAKSGRTYYACQVDGQRVVSYDPVEMYIGRELPQGARIDGDILRLPKEGQPRPARQFSPQGNTKAFAASYAKDVLCTMISSGASVDGQKVLREYFSTFMSLMDGESVRSESTPQAAPVSSGATDSQKRAIENIAKKKGLSVEAVISRGLGYDKDINALTKAEASVVITSSQEQQDVPF